MKNSADTSWNVFRVTELREKPHSKAEILWCFFFVGKNSHCGKTARTWTTTIDEQNLWKSVTLFLYSVNDLAKIRGLRTVGMFAKLCKVRIGFVTSVVRGHLQGTTRLPLDRFSWYLIFEYFFLKFGNSSFTKIWKE